MTELTQNVSWLAVIAGTVLSFLLGWLWYSPRLFGTKWAEGAGVNLGAADAMPMGAMIAQLLGTFLLSWLIGITAGMNALLTAILIALTVMVLIIANGKFANKSTYAIGTEAGFIAAMTVIMIIVQAVL